MKIDLEEWTLGKTVPKNLLRKRGTRGPAMKEKEEKEFRELQEELSDFQERMYARREQSLLLVLQGMDTSGKDSLIEHVFRGTDPMGLEVESFKVPTEKELYHDFLWRTHQRLPERGKIGVFNRSYYEDVIVPFVHPEILAKSKLPEKLRRENGLLKQRCEDIVQYEKYLARQGTTIVKVFLHLSKDEQKERLLARLENPKKHWKFSEGDLMERTLWKKYEEAYGFCLRKTHHRAAPWAVVPADDKPTARLIVVRILVQTLRNMELPDPGLDKVAREKIPTYRKILLSEVSGTKAVKKALEKAVKKKSKPKGKKK